MLCGAISLTSCNSDDNEPVTPVNTGTFTAEKDDEPYVATYSSAVQISGTTTIAGARGVNGEMITIIVQGTTTGTYNNTYMYYQTATQGTQYINVNPAVVMPNGVVTITAIGNGTVSGTFNFTAYTNEEGMEPIVFSEGSFENVPMTVQNTPTSNTVTANLNGNFINFSGAGVVNGDKLGITGMNMNSMMGISIIMPSNITVGSYPIGNDAFSGVFISISNVNEGAVESISGTLNITAKTANTITGNFNFNGEDWDGNAYQVTQGQFNVQYQ